MAETIKIGGELESVATGGIVTRAHRVLDTTKNKTQEQVNQETDETLAAHASAIGGLDGQNYITLVATDADTDIAAVFTRLSVTPAINTVYRIANWKHDATTKYNTAYYSEYAANGTTTTDLVPISVENKGIDDEPTAGSNNLVKSGGIQNEFALGAVYDVSAKNPTAGSNNDGKWESLSALLSDANLSTLIPTSVRKGGMSIKFVCSSDNKYVQYRFMLSAFTATQFVDVANWQGVDDEPVAGSHNLVESGGVKQNEDDLNINFFKFSYIGTYLGQMMDSSGSIYSAPLASYKVIRLNNIRSISITSNSENSGIIAILKEFEGVHSFPYYPVFATGESRRSVGTSIDLILPNDAKYLLVLLSNSIGDNLTPSRILLDDVNIMEDSLFNREVTERKLDSSVRVSLSNIRGSKVSIIGDSISTFDKDGYKINGYSMYYPYGDVKDVEQTYWKKLLDASNAKIEVNASYGGSCVTDVRSSDGYPDFYDRTSLLGNPDVIIVALGTNDSSRTVPMGYYDYNSAIADLSESTFATAYIKGIKNLISLYPNAKIVCVAFMMGDAAYRSAIKEIASHYGLDFVDCKDYTQDSNNNPDADGMCEIANILMRKDIWGKVYTIEDNINDIQGNNNTNVITWEQGSINEFGDTPSDNRIRSVGYVNIENVRVVKCDRNHCVSVVCYDENKSYLNSTSFKSVIYEKNFESNTAYIRILVANAANPAQYPNCTAATTNISPSDSFSCVVEYDNYIKDSFNAAKKIATKDSVAYTDLQLKNTLFNSILTTCDLSRDGYIDASGNYVSTSSWKQYIYKNPNKYNIIRFKTNNTLTGSYKLYKAIAFYSSETQFDSTTYLGGLNFNEYNTGTEKNIYISNIPVGTKSFIIANRNNSGDCEIYGMYNLQGIINDINKNLANILVEKYDSVGNYLFRPTSSTYSDMTWVGNKLVGFTSSSDDLTTDYGTISIGYYDNGIDKNRTNLVELRHYFGHCNTVDYSEGNDCLILGNGSGSYSIDGKIIIIPNFSQFVDNAVSSETPLSLTNVNALVIDCGYDLGTKFNLVWGDDDNYAHNIAYLITANLGGSTSANGGDLQTIRKIVLRKGEDEGEYGTVVANSTPFNGTFDIVETYNQKTAGYANCDQGTCYYNGELYAGIGHDGLWYWRMRMADGQIYRKDYKQIAYSEPLYANYGNVSGICVKDGYLFIARIGIGVCAYRI